MSEITSGGTADGNGSVPSTADGSNVDGATGLPAGSLDTKDFRVVEQSREEVAAKLAREWAEIMMHVVHLKNRALVRVVKAFLLHPIIEADLKTFQSNLEVEIFMRLIKMEDTKMLLIEQLNAQLTTNSVDTASQKG